MSKLYRQIEEVDLKAIGSSWDKVTTFGHHANIWLAEQGFEWDPDKDADENRADFDEVCEAAYARVPKW